MSRRGKYQKQIESLIGHVEDDVMQHLVGTMKIAQKKISKIVKEDRARAIMEECAYQMAEYLKDKDFKYSGYDSYEDETEVE